MQKKIFTKIVAAVFCIIFSCKHVEEEKNPFVLSSFPRIQILEEADHRFCSDLKINFDKRIDLESNLYWRCRWAFAKYQLRTDSSAESVNFNAEITDLVLKISLKLAGTPESILMAENSKMDDRHHKQCLVMGYEFRTEDLTKIDDYFACRRSLITDYKLIPPFGNPQYLEYSNYSYDIGFAVDRRVDKEIERFKAAKKEYPTCVKFHLESLNFQNCKKAQDVSRQCFSEIDRKKFLKEMEEKVICQRRSYIRFPNKFLKEEDLKKAEIARTKANSDFHNQINFASLGVDYKSFMALGKDKSEEEIAKEIEEEEKQKLEEEAKETNSSNKLYDKFELTRLRQKYIFSCQKEADLRVENYHKDLIESCENAAKFSLIED